MGFLLLMIISNILTGIISYKIYQVVSIGKIVNRNLEAGERSVLLIQIIISRLEKKDLKLLLLPQFNTCSSSGVFDRLLMKKSFDLLRLFLNASHMGFCMFFKLSIPFCRRSFGKGRFQIPVQ